MKYISEYKEFINEMNNSKIDYNEPRFRMHKTTNPDNLKLLKYSIDRLGILDGTKGQLKNFLIDMGYSSTTIEDAEKEGLFKKFYDNSEDIEMHYIKDNIKIWSAHKVPIDKQFDHLRKAGHSEEMIKKAMQ